MACFERWRAKKDSMPHTELAEIVLDESEGEARKEPGGTGQHHEHAKMALGPPPPGNHTGEDEAEHPPDLERGMHPWLGDVIARQRQQDRATGGGQARGQDRTENHCACAGACSAFGVMVSMPQLPSAWGSGRTEPLRRTASVAGNGRKGYRC